MIVPIWARAVGGMQIVPGAARQIEPVQTGGPPQVATQSLHCRAGAKIARAPDSDRDLIGSESRTVWSVRKGTRHVPGGSLHVGHPPNGVRHSSGAHQPAFTFGGTQQAKMTNERHPDPGRLARAAAQQTSRHPRKVWAGSEVPWR